jgi:3-hydroxyacyl-[acyl-carrier-protein] dehydratase
MEKIISQKIIEALPYGKAFRFVDNITLVNENEIEGNYYFDADSDYYSHHFIRQPVTPGVLLLECMGQIGLVSHGIYLLDLYEKSFFPAFAHLEADFLHTVSPGAEVKVIAKKIYLRKQVLKSEIKIYINKTDKLAARAVAICNFINKEED